MAEELQGDLHDPTVRGMTVQGAGHRAGKCGAHGDRTTLRHGFVDSPAEVRERISEPLYERDHVVDTKRDIPAAEMQSDDGRELRRQVSKVAPVPSLIDERPDEGLLRSPGAWILGTESAFRWQFPPHNWPPLKPSRGRAADLNGDFRVTVAVRGATGRKTCPVYSNCSSYVYS